MSTGCSVLSADRSFSIFYVAAFAAAMAVLYIEGRRRAWPTSSWLVLVAAGVTFGIIGSRLGAISLADWKVALGQGCLPTTTGKTFVGLIVLGTIGLLLVQRFLGFRSTTGDAFRARPAGGYGRDAVWLPVWRMLLRQTDQPALGHYLPGRFARFRGPPDARPGSARAFLAAGSTRSSSTKSSAGDSRAGPRRRALQFETARQPVPALPGPSRLDRFLIEFVREGAAGPTFAWTASLQASLPYYVPDAPSYSSSGRRPRSGPSLHRLPCPAGTSRYSQRWPCS